MPNKEINISPPRFQAVPLLAQKFIQDYEDAVKDYGLELKLEITEHLINVIELMLSYVETTDQSIWNKFIYPINSIACRRMSKG